MQFAFLQCGHDTSNGDDSGGKASDLFTVSSGIASS